MGITVTKRRKAIRWFLWAITALVAVLASLPVWFPWALKPVLKHYGVSFTSFHRLGYTRFELTGVSGVWDNVRLNAERVECALPGAWLWLNSTSRPPLLIMNGGRLTISGTRTNDTDGKPSESWDRSLGEIVQTGLLLQRVLPRARLTNCAVEISSHKTSVPSLEWTAGLLRASIRLPSFSDDIQIAVQLEGASALALTAVWPAHDASLDGRFTRADMGWRWEGHASWRTNRAEVSAQFATNGWWPSQASLVCEQWRIPAEMIQLKDYEELIASLSLNLVSNRFELQTTGFAHPADSFLGRELGPVRFALAADGSSEAATVRNLHIELPWLAAELTNAFGIARTGKFLTDAAVFRVALNLGQFPGLDLGGQVEGVVRVEPKGDTTPVARFNFSGRDVRVSDVNAARIAVAGKFNFARLQFDEFAASFADGSALQLNGAFDFHTRQIQAADWRVSGALWQRFFTGVSYDNLTASGRLSGALTNLIHSGEIKIAKLNRSGLKPADARASWQGTNLTGSVDVELKAGATVLSVAGEVDYGQSKEREITATLRQVSLLRNNEKGYTLVAPCQITFRSEPANDASRDWLLRVDAFDWQGAAGRVSLAADLAWPSRGRVAAAMTNVAFADFADFVAGDVAQFSLAKLEVAAGWSNGPIHSKISFMGSMTNRSGQPLSLHGQVASGELLTITQLSVASGFTPALAIGGTLPIQVIPGRAEGVLHWDSAKPIALAGQWSEQQPEEFSIPLPGQGELKISKPGLQVQVEGTAEKPLGSLKITAARIDWHTPTNNLIRPTLENFQLSAEIRPDLIKLAALEGRLDGQQIQAQGEWPMSDQAWRNVWAERKLPDWTAAHGRLWIESAQVAALSRYLPHALAPEGQVSLNLDLKPGRQLQGFLSLTNAATRPFGKVTPLRDIAAQVRLDGDRATLEDFRGQIGGQPVRASGYVTFPDREGLDYQLSLRGTNVPLARSLEFLLRGDFDVQLRGSGNLPPLVSGAVNLRDGLYLQHASALVWSGPKRTELHPPYFSVTNQPFADWKTDLSLTGDRFLRVRTPIFSGLVSAGLKLKGTLRTPVLTGDARVSSGRILFPFGTLNVNQAYASFSGNDAQGPDLQISAVGRNYRYDVRLEVKGPADDAQVIFSSTPPLTSEAILLMLTAGEMPQSNFGFSSGERAGRLASFLGKDLLSRYLGDDQGEERLIIRTGENVSEEGRLTYSVEYRLTDRWSIIGQYDEFNAFNTDLKWKVFTR